MIHKIQVYIESVILGVGKQNRGGTCAILVANKKDSEPYRKVVTQYDGQNVKAAESVKNMAQQAVDALTAPCWISFASSARAPRGLNARQHAFDWQTIPEGSDGWQIRASFAAWEIALGGRVTEQILELAASVPPAPAKGLFLYASRF